MKECAYYQTFKRRLAEYCGKGVTSSFFKQSLAPEWWKPEMGSDTALTTSLAYVVGQRLGVTVSSLLGDGPIVPLDTSAPHACKTRSCDNDSAVEKTLRMLRQLAKAILSGFVDQGQIPSGSAASVRSAIMRKSQLVDFNALLDFCWESGLPVVCLSSRLHPSGGQWHRPQACVIRHGEHHCIFLLGKHDFSAQPLFLLAHELGHIACRHLAEGQDDCQLDNDLECRGQNSQEEREANEFALQLLENDFQALECPGYHPKQIADWALRTGRDSHIDPGHLVMRDAFVKSSRGADSKRVYACSQAALKIINQTSCTNPLVLVRKKLFAYLPMQEYSDSQEEFIVHATGLVTEEQVLDHARLS